MSRISDQPEFVRASSITLAVFADLYTRSFENYFYPMLQTTEAFAARIRFEQLDLHHSVVMCVHGDAVGQATLGIRDGRGWCGGFGIVPTWRGQGLAPHLFATFLEWARAAGVHKLGLEVLTRNGPALKVYVKAGMHIVRDLYLLQWHAAADRLSAIPDATADFWNAKSFAAFLPHFARLHPARPCWSRDVPTLLVRRDQHALALGQRDHPDGYVIYSVGEQGAFITDFAATGIDPARQLLRFLQARHHKIKVTNEPGDSALTSAFFDLGFVESDRQHELAMSL